MDYNPAGGNRNFTRPDIPPAAPSSESTLTRGICYINGWFAQRLGPYTEIPAENSNSYAVVVESSESRSAVMLGEIGPWVSAGDKIPQILKETKMDYETIRYSVEDQVALLTYNRPDQRNAINRRMNSELQHAWQRFRDDDDAFVLVMTGSGEAFCACWDLADAA